MNRITTDLTARVAVVTPWGCADFKTDYGNGITFYSTPSHGGFFVPPGFNMQIPLEVREATHNKQGKDGWYEEDCDWSIVAKFFPELFVEQEREQAGATYRHWIMPNVGVNAQELEA